MPQPKTVILIGAGQRGNAYSAHALSKPDHVKIIGVAEPDDTRRGQFQKKYQIEEVNCFSSWEDVFKKEKWADSVFICTQDKMHYQPVMAAIRQGYDILLEKPISPSKEECLEIVDAVGKSGVKVVVCHVLRYTPFFSTIKDVVDSGEIGDIVSVAHNENVWDIHQAHSFVRGNWSVTDDSAPMILAKSCHDLDIMQWIMGKKCLRLSSFGSLQYFCAANAPKNAPARCMDGCAENCPYDARKLYLESKNEWFRSVAAGHANPSNADVEAALASGPYGRCVFQCDNDVVDHQVVAMEFEGGATAMFSMCAFTYDMGRSLKIMGTKGQIKAHESSDIIKVASFITRSERDVKVPRAIGGHGGGDSGIVSAFLEYIDGKQVPSVTEIGVSAQNHSLCFAAEESRLSGGKMIEL